MYHNAFRQYLRWNSRGHMRGGMEDVPDDEAQPAEAEAPEEAWQYNEDVPAEAQQEAWQYQPEEEIPAEPPQQFWQYNQEQLALPPAATAYQKYCSDWVDWKNFVVPGGGEEEVPDGEEFAWEDRMPSGQEYNNRKWNLEQNGIKVRTRVELSFLFGHENPLLVIRVDKQPDWHLSNFVAEKTTNTLVHRHVSIGYMKKIIEAEVPDWNNKLRQLYEKFHDRELWLWGNWVNNNAVWALRADDDPIASDAIVREFHATLVKWNQEGAEWVEHVPDLHISL